AGRGPRVRHRRAQADGVRRLGGHRFLRARSDRARPRVAGRRRPHRPDRGRVQGPDRRGGDREAGDDDDRPARRRGRGPHRRRRCRRAGM
ncbi:MAG: hypothetical protein AVDCRST_MAG41-368, partial [uncultured Corynebacteriales bacterium]